MKCKCLMIPNRPLLGLFLLGMLTERVNHHAALLGVVAGVLTMLYYGLTQLICPPGGGDSKAADLPSICAQPLFSWWLTRLESWWSGVLGTGTTMLVGGLSSWCFGAPASSATRGLTIWSNKRSEQQGLFGEITSPSPRDLRSPSGFRSSTTTDQTPALGPPLLLCVRIR